MEGSGPVMEQHFWKSQFVPLLLLAVLALFLGVVLFAVHCHDGNLAAWAQSDCKEVLAALLMALTARAVTRTSDNGKPTP